MSMEKGVIAVVGCAATVVATVVTVLAFQDSHADHGRPQHVIIDNQPEPVPSTPDQVDPASIEGDPTAAPVSQSAGDPADACAAGDPSACAALLDDLASGCYGGDGLSCDVLYELSPYGSIYEDYGATCGYRVPDWSYADLFST